MNRVALVNLAGRAWSIEEQGVAALDAWLESARTTLASDPDRDELLADFERAIADKCSAVADDDRAVVTEAQIATILESLGTVEPAVTMSDPADTPTETIAAPAAPAPTEDSWRTRRLYRMEGDDAMIAGVCAGIGAWMRVDVTVVRVATVLLTILTSGGFAVAYIALWLLLPVAETPDEKAAAYGFGTTAQDLMARARTRAVPALSTLGTTLRRIVVVVTRVARVFAIALIALVLAAWLITSIWSIAAGDPLLQAFDDGTSGWMLALLSTCCALIVLIPLLVIANALDAAVARMTNTTRRAKSRFSVVWSVAGFVTWVTAIAGVVLIIVTSSEQILNVLDHGQGRVHIDDDTLCFRQEDWNGANDDPCQPGDDVVTVD